MTFEEWRKQLPCPARKGYPEHVVDCLHCGCASEAWVQQAANYAPLVKAYEDILRTHGVIMHHSDLKIWSDVLKAVKDG